MSYPFKASGYFTYHKLLISKNSPRIPSAHTVYLCVLCVSQNKQRLFPYTQLTERFLKRRQTVYCAVRTETFKQPQFVFILFLKVKLVFFFPWKVSLTSLPLLSAITYVCSPYSCFGLRTVDVNTMKREYKSKQNATFCRNAISLNVSTTLTFYLSEILFLFWLRINSAWLFDSLYNDVEEPLKGEGGIIARLLVISTIFWRDAAF
jgi:hypothetical protein